MKKNFFKTKLNIIFIMAVFSFNLNLKADAGELLYKIPVNVRNLVLYQLKEGNFNEAENILNQEYYINSNVNFILALAELYIETEQYDKARSTLNLIKLKAPKNIYLKYLTSVLRSKTMQEEEEGQYAQRILDKDIRNSGAYIALGNVNLNKAKKTNNPQKKLEFLDESQKYFYYAGKYNTESSDPHIGMAKVYVEKKRDSKAYDEIMVADEMGVYSPDSQYFIGEFFYRVGNYDKAIYSLKKPVLYNSKRDIRPHLLLGKIYEKLNDVDNAKKEYAIAKKISPGNVEANHLLNNLSYFLATTKKINITETKKKILNNNEKLNMAENYLIQDKLASARYLYLQVLENDPNNIDARAFLMEIYYSQWGIGYFNPKNFFLDNKYFDENDSENPKLEIPYLKLRIISTPKISPLTKDKLTEIRDNDSNQYTNLLNATRAAFLLEDYSNTQKLLTKLLNTDLSDQDKFNISKALYLDRDFYDAQKLLSHLGSSFNPEILKLFKAMLDSKFKKAEEIQQLGLALYKKKLYTEAILKFQEGNSYFPTYSYIYINMAETYHKMNDQKKTLNSIEKFNNLKEIYPYTDDDIYSEKAQKLIDAIKKQNEKLNKQRQKDNDKINKTKIKQEDKDTIMNNDTNDNKNEDNTSTISDKP